MFRRPTTYLIACTLIAVAGVHALAAPGAAPASAPVQQEDPLRFARSLYREGLYDVAIGQLREQLATGLPPQIAEEGRWLLAQALEAVGRTREAADAYLDFTHNHGSSARAPEGWLRAGDLLARSGDPKGAADAYSNFLDLFPMNDQRPRASLGLIETLLTDGRAEEALVRVMEAHADYPFHPLEPRFLLLEAEARDIIGERELAISLTDDAMERAMTPEVRADASALKARLLIEDGFIDEAITAVQTAIDAPAPAERLPYLKGVLGQALVASGRNQEALPELREALAAVGGRERTMAAIWLARAHSAIGEPDSALAAYDLALDSLSGDEAATIALEAVRTAEERNALTTALLYADRARAESESSEITAGAVATAAEILVTLGRAPEAIDRYRSFFEQTDLPNDIRATAAMELGRLYENYLTDPGAAAGYYRMAAISAGTGELWARALWGSANALAAQGQYASAITELVPLSGAGGEWGTKAGERIHYWRTYRLVDLEEGLRILQGAVLELASGGREGSTGSLLEIARANAGPLKDYETAIDAYDRYLAVVTDGPEAAQAYLEKGRALEALATIAGTEEGEEEAAGPAGRAAEAYREAVRVGGTSEASERAQLALIELDLSALREEPVLFFQAMRDRYRSFLDVFTTSDRLNDVLLRLGEANEGLGAHADPSYYGEAADVYRLLLEEGKPPVFQRMARLGLGRSLYHTGEYEQAAAALEASLLDLPDDAARDEILFMAGDSRMRIGENEAAVVHFRELEGRFPESEWAARSSEVSGDLLLEQGRVEEAVSSYRRFEERCAADDLARARFKLASALARAEEWTECLQKVREAVAEGSLDPEMRKEALLLRASAAIEESDREEELAAYRALWSEIPESAEAFEIAPLLGSMLSDRGELGAAEQVWTAVAARTQSDTLRIRAEAELIYLAYAGGRVITGSERKTAFEETYRRERDVLRRYRPFFWAVEGQMWLQREEWDRAESVLNQILEDASDSPYVPLALYGVGMAALWREDTERSVELFRDLTERFPDDPWANRAKAQLAAIAYSEADYETALALFRTAAVSDDPYLAEQAQYRIIEVLERMRYWESAQQEALNYLERFPGSERLFEVKMQLGRLYRDGGQFGRATEYFRNIQAPDSEGEARVRFQLAETLFAMGNYDEAVLEYMKVAILNEDQFLFAVTARLNAADCYAYLGQRDTAIDLYQQIILRYGADSDYGRVAREHMDNVQAGLSPRYIPPEQPPR